MIKLMIAIRRRQDLTFDEFKNYYEKKHAPLAVSLFPQVVFYKRNYVLKETMFGSVGIKSSSFDYDVLTEMAFVDQTTYDEFLATAAISDIAEKMAADEAIF